MFNDKNIFITGGTGSFGKTFVKTLLENYSPRKIVIYSRDELKQYTMAHDYSSDVMRYFIGDVRDAERLKQAMKGIDYVVHAAALKHVPVAEYNPMECIKTNIYGAENVIKAAIANNVEKVVALSTDKAANPINLYGATKLASDKLFIAANNMVGASRTRFSVVRYGNVVGSRGSVLPYFIKLLKGGASQLPITDERMTRFWITLEQGIAFVINCFENMQGGGIYVPKIPSIRITDLATSLNENIKLNFVGIRPGEKLHEIMVPADDSIRTIEFDNYYLIKPAIDFNHETDFNRNLKDEIGQAVPDGFEYNSGSNPHFLSIKEIADMTNSTTITLD